eukprot:4210676-Prymnesium_polylepis.1
MRAAHHQPPSPAAPPASAPVATPASPYVPPASIVAAPASPLRLQLEKSHSSWCLVRRRAPISSCTELSSSA